MQYKRVCFVIVFVIYSLVLIYRINRKTVVNEIDLILNPNVNIIDLNSSILNQNFSCMKTKKILDLTSTTICIYISDDTVSESLVKEQIWEENQLKFILKILIANPEMIMIDIGASIGSYSMFTAGVLRRLTISIDCFLPNIERIAEAVRLEHIQNQIILIHNVLYWKSGEQLQIRYDDPTEIQLNIETSRKRSFTVKSIEFDDLLPILRKHQVKTALIKIDIETSESYMCQTGEKIFDEINIPFVMMEWHSWRIHHRHQYELIIKFFTKRDYLVINQNCEQLQLSQWLTNWPGNIFWIKKYFLKKLSCQIFP